MATNSNNNKKSIKGALIIAVAVMLVLVIGWHLIFPLLGIAVAVTASAWAIIVLSIVLFALSGLLFLIFPVIVIFIICLLAFAWLLISLMLFPFLFPVLAPLFIVLLFVAYLRRKKAD